MYSNQYFKEKVLPCSECNEEFVFTAEEQDFYQQKGYSAPKRCPNCRANRRQQSGGGRGPGGGGGARRSYNKPQYEVICSNCGVETTVPFEPSDDRPVYCSECFRNRY